MRLSRPPVAWRAYNTWLPALFQWPAGLAVRVFDEPLLIRPRKLYVILQAIAPRLGLTDADVDLIALRADVGSGLASVPTEVLQRNAHRFRGEFLDGLDLPDCYRYHEWWTAERESIRALRVDILSSLADRLRHDPTKQKVVVLLTDGGHNVKEGMPPLDAAQLAAELKIKVYTIGAVGNRFGKPARVAWLANDFGASGVIGDPTQATAELGRDVLAAMVTRLGDTLAEIARFDFEPGGSSLE